ncbi:hypothetical protein PRIPAC_77942, partial [Pristionchus pacificus]|uniref:Ion channel n=1 Tax=Pristionchus pacificus TaxID=54126 RepID=A0A2A6C2Y4_PRIPA
MIEWYTQAHPFLPSLGFYEKENGFTVARDFNLISPLSSAVVSTLTRVSNGGQACIEWTLEVKSYTQGATYTLVALISNISGHAGLWLGMSVVSVVELIGLIFMCFNALFCGRKFNLADEDEIK